MYIGQLCSCDPRDQKLMHTDRPNLEVQFVMALGLEKESGHPAEFECFVPGKRFVEK